MLANNWQVIFSLTFSETKRQARSLEAESGIERSEKVHDNRTLDQVDFQQVS